MSQSLSAAVLGLASGKRVQECLNELASSHPELAPRLVDLFNAVTSDAQTFQTSSAGASVKAEALVERRVLQDSEVLSKLPGLSLLQPRGKFDVCFGQDTLFLSNAKSLLCMPYDDVRRVYILDGMPAERKNKICLMLEAVPGKEVEHGKKKLQCVSIDLKEGLKLSAPHPKRSKDGSKKADIEGEAAVVVCTLLGVMRKFAFVEPDKSVFAGSGGRACLAANFKTSQGYLYPFPNALVYVGSPCQVTRHVDILGVDMPGAGGGLKTFGIVVHDKAGEIITEYSQLEAADLEPWMRYMADVGLKRVAGEAQNTDDELEQSSASESEDDEDFDPAAEAAASGPRKRARTDGAGTSAAAGGKAAAGEGSGDDDDDEDEEVDDDDYESDDISDPEMEDEAGCSVKQLDTVISKQSKPK